MKLHRLALISFFVLISAANAQTLSSEFGFTTGNTVGQSTTEINQTGSLQLFNSSLGTLTGASLQLFGAGTTTISLKNNVGTDQSAGAEGSITLFFASGLSALNPLVTPNVFDLVVTVPNQSIPANSTEVFGPTLKTQNVTLDLATILADLQAPGGGTFTINGLSSSGIAIVGGGGNVAASQTTTAGIGARITYTYTPSVIPEPGQALSTLALCTFGLMLRRRAAKR